MQDNVPFELSKASGVFNFVIIMSFLIHASLDSIPTSIPVTYFKQEYLETQNHPVFRGYSSSDLFIPFYIEYENAISIPRSPFGSFYQKKEDKANLITFWKAVLDDMRDQGIKRVEIRNPTPIYSSFPQYSVLEDMGFAVLYKDLNQHINLTGEVYLHQMQKRKLKALKEQGFRFSKMDSDQLETAHKFLTVCREAQGLQINTSWEHLKKLATAMPGTYECFGVFREKKISALCITVKVTDKVAYYYLPGTSPMFRNQSPMVMLIDGMVDHYRDDGFEYFDLGVSSFEGRIQETLKVFKERIGAIETEKVTFALDL